MEAKNTVVTENRQGPAFKLKVGNVDVVLWSNESDKGEYLTVNFAKNYKDMKGEWQKTTNLAISDIPNLILGLEKAYEFAKVKN